MTILTEMQLYSAYQPVFHGGIHPADGIFGIFLVNLFDWWDRLVKCTLGWNFFL